MKLFLPYLVRMRSGKLLTIRKWYKWMRYFSLEMKDITKLNPSLPKKNALKMVINNLHRDGYL